jgi:hypothetical protein
MSSVTDQPLDTPVAMFVFNRPHAAAELLQAVRSARPKTLLVVADGPRPDHPTDVDLCAQASAVATDVDWPCTVHVLASDINLGCDVRVQSGLDWVFSTVERAIIFEDDVVPHGSMFQWCQRMLDRHADDPSVSMVSGRNPLGKWGRDNTDQLITRRGSIYGWATWAQSWNTLDRTWPERDPTELALVVDALQLPPLVRRHLTRVIDLAQQGRLAAWDNRWDATRLLADTWAVVSPVNLTCNIGFGDGATRTSNASDLRSSIPVWSARPISTPESSPQPDPDFDHASFTVDLLAAHLRPEVTRRIAQRPHLLHNEDGTVDEDLLLHLAPMMDPQGSRSLIGHLLDAGVEGTAIDRLAAALTDAVPGPGAEGS